jgi:transcription elongation factor GreA
LATIPITLRGAEKLKAELHQLKTVERPWVINAIAEARAQGDLSENAEYDAAKDRQGFVEGRIQEVEGKLSAAQIIDPSSVDAGGRVVFGATVELEEESSGEVVKYQIVGEDEADLKLGLVNISSPIARALIGKEEGDVAVVQAPGGEKRYEIVRCLTSNLSCRYQTPKALCGVPFLFFPMFSHPKRGLDESEFSIALASQCIGWIALTMKNHNACIAWNLGRRPIIGGPAWNAVILETRTPLGRPISQFALSVHKVRKISLFISEGFSNAVKVLSKVCQDIGMCP